MNLFATLLWKEWRDQRTALLGYCIGVPPLIVGGLAALSAARRVDPLLPTMAALGGFAIATLTLFGDLFASEEQRGTIKLLRRLPRGLAQVFLAKLAFLATAAALMSGVAWLATAVAATLFHGAPFPPELRWPAFPRGTEYLVPLAAWIPVAAIWLARATLALPAAALLLALFAAPIATATWLLPWVGPNDHERTFGLFAATLAGPVVAGISFVRGRRRSSRPFAPACVGLIATLACVAPAYGWTGWRLVRGLAVDPAADSFRLIPNFGALSPDGTTAWVTAFHSGERAGPVPFTGYEPTEDGPLHALRLELASGRWHQAEPIGGTAFPPGFFADQRSTSVVQVLRDAWQLGDPSQSTELFLYDTASGARIDPVFARELVEASGPRAGAVLREACSLRLPDGRRVWRQDGALRIDPGRELPGSEFRESRSRLLFANFAVAGHGVFLGEGEWYDPSRERRFTGLEERNVRFIRSGRWIVGASSAGNQGWFSFDPERDELAPLVGKDELARPVGLAPDGRLLTFVQTKGDKRPAGLALIDPDTLHRETVAIDPAGAGLLLATAVGSTASGALVGTFHDGAGSGTTRYGRLDLVAGAAPRLVVTAALEMPSDRLGVIGEDELLAIEAERRVVRLRYGSDQREVVFPKPADASEDHR